MKLFRLVLAGCALLVLAACGGSSNASDDGTGEDATALLQSATSAIERAKSFHFELKHENGTTPIILGLNLVSASGDVSIPDRIAADVKAKTGPVNVSVKVIGISDRTWITNPFTRDWMLQSGTSLSDIADPAALVRVLVGQLQDTKVEGTDNVDGVASKRISGTIDSGALKVALPSAEPGNPAKVLIWLGENDSLPRRARIEGPLSDDEEGDIVREVTFSKFDEPVTIQPPV